MKTAIIGAGTDLGVHIDGTKFGPSQLINDIKASYKGEIVSIMQDDKIIKSRNLSDRRKNEYEVNKFNTFLYQKEIEEIKKGLFPITVGGDQTVSIASTLADVATNKHEIGLILINSHPDYNTFETTVTGNLHGLACAAINGYECDELRKFHTGDIVDPRNTVVIGVRNIDPWEKDNVKYSGITVYTTDDLKKKGIQEIMQEAFEIATRGKKEVHVSYNLGVIDPEYALGISVPEVDGISEDDAMTILDEIVNNLEKVSSMDIIGLNPLRDIDRKTEQIALNILATIIQKVENYKGIKKVEKKY